MTPTTVVAVAHSAPVGVHDGGPVGETPASCPGIPTTGRCHRLDLGLRRGRGKCAGKPCRISEIGLELGLRTAQQNCAQNPNEISAFDPKLELRDVPGKLAQRPRQTQRFRYTIALPAIQNPMCDEIIRITLSPLFLLLPPAGHLTIRISTSSLTQANTRIGPEPTPANTAGFLSGI